MDDAVGERIRANATAAAIRRSPTCRYGLTGVGRTNFNGSSRMWFLKLGRLIHCDPPLILVEVVHSVASKGRCGGFPYSDASVVRKCYVRANRRSSYKSLVSGAPMYA